MKQSKIDVGDRLLILGVKDSAEGYPKYLIKLLNTYTAVELKLYERISLGIA